MKTMSFNLVLMAVWAAYSIVIHLVWLFLWPKEAHDEIVFDQPPGVPSTELDCIAWFSKNWTTLPGIVFVSFMC